MCREMERAFCCWEYWGWRCREGAPGISGEVRLSNERQRSAED